MIYLLFIISTIIFWLLGGQFGSAFRKYGCMASIILLFIWRITQGSVWWHIVPILLICPAMFLGYGEKSWFMKVFKNEELVRIAEGIVLWIPMALCSILQTYYWSTGISIALTVGAFQIRAGSLKIGNKDFLLEDLFRSLALGISIILVVR